MTESSENSAPIKRADGRQETDLRPISFEIDFVPYAAGSVLINFGKTRVICAASIENGVPGWMRHQNVEGGWMTAEYSMLPYSTLERKHRDVNKGKIEGRTVEIQRLIGRALRAVLDLKKLGKRTLWIDCDVLQADGGTRTAAITGAYVAAQIAIQRLMEVGKIAENPFSDSVGAVSVGIVDGLPLVDLDYSEDFAASVDANLVMAGNGEFVEVQSSGEGATFSREAMDELLDRGARAIHQIEILQKQAITTGLAKR